MPQYAAICRNMPQYALICDHVLASLQAEMTITKREVDEQRRDSEAGSLRTASCGGSWRWATNIGEEELEDSDDFDAAHMQQIPTVASYQIAGNRQSLARYAAREISTSPLRKLKKTSSGLAGVEKQGSLLLRHASRSKSDTTIAIGQV